MIRRWVHVSFISFTLFTEAPVINATCHSSKRWLMINWTPPPMTYDMLTGYSVWYWSESSSNWSKLSVGSEITSLNVTNLGECKELSMCGHLHRYYGHSANSIVRVNRIVSLLKERTIEQTAETTTRAQATQLRNFEGGTVVS